MEQKVKVSSGKIESSIGRSIMLYESNFSSIMLYESNFSFLIQVLGAEVGSYLQFTVFVRFRIFAFFASVPEHTPICLW